MATNVADEIRKAEEDAREILKNARSEAAKIVSQAKTEAERQIKENKQKSHRNFVEQMREFEAEAEATAAGTIENGRKKSEDFLKHCKPNVSGVTRWIAEEVMARYGRDSN